MQRMPRKACYALVDRARAAAPAGHRPGAVACASSWRAMRVVLPVQTPRSHTRACLRDRRALAQRRARCSRCSPRLRLQAAIGRYPAPGKSAYHAAATPLVLLEQGIPDLKGRLTEGTPGGNGLPGVRLRLLVRARGPPARRAGHDAHRRPTARSPSRCASTPIATCTARWYCTATACPGSRPASSRSAAWAERTGGFPARRANMRACRGRSYRPMGRPRRRPTSGAVKACLDGGEHFWLDIGHPEADELEQLSDLLELHPLVRDDLGAFVSAREGRRLPDATRSSSCSARRTTRTASSRCTQSSPRSGS